MTANMQNGSDSSHDNNGDNKKQRTVRFDVTNERIAIDQSEFNAQRLYPRRPFQNQVIQTLNRTFPAHCNLQVQKVAFCRSQKSEDPGAS